MTDMILTTETKTSYEYEKTYIKNLTENIGYYNGDDQKDQPHLTLINHPNTLSSELVMDKFLYMMTLSFDVSRYKYRRNFNDPSETGFKYTQCSYTEELVRNAFNLQDNTSDEVDHQYFKNSWYFTGDEDEIQIFSIAFGGHKFPDHIFNYIKTSFAHYIVQSYYNAYSINAPYGVIKLNKKEQRVFEGLLGNYVHITQVDDEFRENFRQWNKQQHPIRQYSNEYIDNIWDFKLNDEDNNLLLNANFAFQRFTGILSHLHSSDVRDHPYKRSVTIKQLNKARTTNRVLIKDLLTSMPVEHILHSHYSEVKKTTSLTLNWCSYLTPECVYKNKRNSSEIIKNIIYLQSYLFYMYHSEEKYDTTLKNYIKTNFPYKLVTSHLSEMSGLRNFSTSVPDLISKTHPYNTGFLVLIPIIDVWFYAKFDAQQFQTLLQDVYQLFKSIPQQKNDVNNAVQTYYMAETERTRNALQALIKLEKILFHHPI